MKRSFFILLIVLFCTGCMNKADKKEFENFKSVKEIQNQNKEIARALFTAIDKNDFVKINELLSDDFSLSAPNVQQPWNKENLFEAIKTFYTAFPDWTHNLNDLIAEGDKVVVKLTCRGTQKTTYENFSPTGKPVTQDAIHILTIIDGKVKDFWALEDNLGFQVQLGMELKQKL